MPPEIGFRSENIRIAEQLIPVLEEAVEQLARLLPTFITSFSRATYLDDAPVIRNAEDLEEYWRRKDEQSENLRKDLSDLRERLSKVVEQCRRALWSPIRLVDDSEDLNNPVDQDPRGAPSKTNYWKERTAIAAGGLMSSTAAKTPAAGHPNSSFCIIASRLFEIVTGEHDPNLVRACKSVLRQLKDVRWAEENLQNPCSPGDDV
jgi:hypothetical protein